MLLPSFTNVGADVIPIAILERKEKKKKLATQSEKVARYEYKNTGKHQFKSVFEIIFVKQ